MYEQFSKHIVVKKVFGAVMVVAFGCCIGLASLSTAEEGAKDLVPITGVQLVAAVACDQPLGKSPSASEALPLEEPLPPKSLSMPEALPLVKALHKKNPSAPEALLDFTYAARVVTPAVVYIKASQNPKLQQREAISPLEQLFKEFFGDRLLVPKEYERPARKSSGSGVIYTSDGYIITNNHVVEGADAIDVTLNDNRSYKATLVGSDPVTDLALLKIEASHLPVLVLGNSDTLEVGEWVLAVGNPFNLHSTVTKGIVSAKSRHLDSIGNGKLSIQSFIQTDAVINAGNSGGALVNLYGELVGINTAIYVDRSPSFIGYGFAIPSSLVKKVADDFIHHGAVQRVLLGITIQDVHAKLAQKLSLKVISGVYISKVSATSPCARVIQKGDVITQVNDRKINKTSELQEFIGCCNPGDRLTITLYRKGKEQKVNVLLVKQPDAMPIVQKDDTLKAGGAIFQNLDKQTTARLKLSGGVLVQEVSEGKFQAAGLRKGCVVLAFDRQPVKDIAHLAVMIRNATEAVLIQVMEPSKGRISYLAVELGPTRE